VRDFVTLTQLVSTLAAALEKWKLRTLRTESAHKVRTYSSPFFSESTILSLWMYVTWAQSKVILTPSWGSEMLEKLL
jgi:hypothetical protein